MLINNYDYFDKKFITEELFNLSIMYAKNNRLFFVIIFSSLVTNLTKYF